MIINVFLVGIFLSSSIEAAVGLDEASSSVDEPQNTTILSELELNNTISINKIIEDFEKTIIDNENSQIGVNSSGVENSAAAVVEDAVDGEDTIVARNMSSVNRTEATPPKPRVMCSPPPEGADLSDPRVLVLNGTELQARLSEENNPNVTNRTFPGVCSVTLFYASWCDFSAKAAPHYNALARFFPALNFYALDSTVNHVLNAQYGVIAVPTILVFHNSRALYRFNHSTYSLENYKDFVNHLTGIEPANISFTLTPEDMEGPVKTDPVKPFNYNLLFAALFILACGVVDLSKSSVCRGLVDTLRNAWREAEIQHEHQE